MKTFFRIQVLLILFLFCILEDCITIGTVKNAFDPEYDRSGIYNSIPLGSAEKYSLGENHSLKIENETGTYCMFQLEDGEIPEGENFIRLEMINDDFFASNKWGLLLLPFTLALDAVLWPFEIITLIMLSGWKT